MCCCNLESAITACVRMISNLSLMLFHCEECDGLHQHNSALACAASYYSFRDAKIHPHFSLASCKVFRQTLGLLPCLIYCDNISQSLLGANWTKSQALSHLPRSKPWLEPDIQIKRLYCAAPLFYFTAHLLSFIVLLNKFDFDYMNKIFMWSHLFKCVFEGVEGAYNMYIRTLPPLLFTL